MDKRNRSWKPLTYLKPIDGDIQLKREEASHTKDGNGGRSLKNIESSSERSISPCQVFTPAFQTNKLHG